MPEKTIRVSKRQMGSPLSRSEFDTFKKEQAKKFKKPVVKKKSLLKKASLTTIADRKRIAAKAKKEGVSSFVIKSRETQKRAALKKKGKKRTQEGSASPIETSLAKKKTRISPGEQERLDRKKRRDARKARVKRTGE